MKNADFFDLKQLAYFRAAMLHPTLREAARQLGIAQPTLTRSIQNLEEELGVPLLQRGPRGSRPTEAGSLFLERVEQLLGMATDARSVLDGLRGNPAGVVTLGISPGFAMAFLPSLLPRFHALLPEIHVRVMEGSTYHIAQWLAAAQVDLGIIISPSGSKQLIEETILQDELVLISRKPMGKKPFIPFAEIAGLPLILSMLPNVSRKYLNQLAARARCRLQPILEIDSPYVTKQLILQHDYYTVQTRIIFADEIKRRRVFVKRISPTPIRNLAIATQRGASLSVATRTLAHEIRKLIKGSGIIQEFADSSAPK